ncbi:hypothetical protein [Flavobacterium sp.]|uniref:hypothetical protein n=1 Tax=Flavobacterium sp. TaxID=239 RepID=UPI003B9C6FFF
MYRIDIEKKSVNSIIDTRDFRDFKRINRYTELKPLFILIFNYCSKEDISVSSLLNKILAYNDKIKETSFNHKTEYEICFHARNLNLIWYFDEKQFIDFLLEIAKEEVQNETSQVFPDRSQSQFFFSKKEDCYTYLSKFKHKLKKVHISKNEIFEEREIFISDNSLLSNIDFHKSILNQKEIFKNYYLKNYQTSALLEVTFIGKYKVISIETVSLKTNFLSRFSKELKRLFRIYQIF